MCIIGIHDVMTGECKCDSFDVRTVSDGYLKDHCTYISSTISKIKFSLNISA